MSSENPATETGDGGANIQVWSDLQHIRARPSMYIGSTDARGLHYFLFAPVNNSIDEWRANSCTRIDVELLADGGCSVIDNGRGIPVNIPPRGKKRWAEIHLTEVACGHRNFELAIINALSERLLVRISRDGKVWEQEYHRGVAACPMEEMCDTTATGTCLTFWPDREIFQVTREFDHAFVSNRLRELAFLLPGLEIHLRDRRSQTYVTKRFHAKDGVGDFLAYRNRAETPSHPAIRFHMEAADKKASPSIFDAAIQWTASSATNVVTFANTYYTTAGGSHLGGVHGGLLQAIREFEPTRKRFVDELPTIDDILVGLTGVVSVQIPDPQFESQSRIRLNNPEVEPFVRTAVSEQLLQYLETHPAHASAILDRIERGRA